MLGWLSLGSLVAVPVAAKTIHVPADEPKIQAAVLAASAGDTVLVAPGTYTELIQMRNGVVLRSAAGPDSTFLLTPQLEESPLDERLLECLGGIDRSTVIEGFSLDGSAKPGAGIYCENGSPTIRGNRISGFGWGINLRHSTALIEENVIEKTTTFGILAFASSPEIYRNEFANNGGRVIVISGKLSQPIVGGSRENANKFFGNRIVVSNSNDFERTNRGRGKVDYRHWILPEGEAAGTGPGSLLAGRTWIPIAAAAILVVVFVVLSRRSRTAANT
jgi:hypothetical protein